MPLPPYPQILTSADWSKKKGLIARIVAEPTKLGEALKKAEGAYKSVSWDNIFKKPPEGSPLKVINDQIARVGTVTKEETNKLKIALHEVATQAGTVKQTWASNNLIPKDVKVHVDKIIATVPPFVTNLDSAIKGGMTSLFVMQQQREFLNEKEAKEEERAQPVVKTGPKKEGITTKFKKDAPLAGKKPAAKERESGESEGTE
jgi:hypothetical protein